MGGNTRLLMWLIDTADERDRLTGEARGNEAVGEIQIIGLKEGEQYDGEFIEFVTP